MLLQAFIYMLHVYIGINIHSGALKCIPTVLNVKQFILKIIAFLDCV